VEKNNEGAGAYMDAEGHPAFWFSKDCPIHGGANPIDPNKKLQEI